MIQRASTLKQALKLAARVAVPGSALALLLARVSAGASAGGLVRLGVGGQVSGAGDWWDPNDAGLCIWAAYSPEGAADLASSYLDLSGNGNNAGVGVAPTWDAVNGWKLTTAQYLTTTFAPQIDQSQTLIVKFSNLTNTGVIAGCYEGFNRQFRIQPDNGSAAVLYGNGNQALKAPALSAGNLCVAGSDGYRDGVSESIGIGGWGVATARTVFIGGMNQGSLQSGCAVYIQKMALYDCTLTSSEVAAVYAAM